MKTRNLFIILGILVVLIIIGILISQSLGILSVLVGGTKVQKVGEIYTLPFSGSGKESWELCFSIDGGPIGNEFLKLDLSKYDQNLEISSATISGPWISYWCDVFETKECTHRIAQGYAHLCINCDFKCRTMPSDTRMSYRGRLIVSPKTDPCEGIVCEDKCENSIRYYDGYCSDGECNYKTTTCDYGCLGDKCKGEPCEGIVCEDKCENSIWYYNGECNPSTGQCEFASQDTCQFGCQNEPPLILTIVTGQGMCRADSCIGIACDDYCIGDEKNTLATGGKCINGKCVYPESGEKPYAEECGWTPWYKNILIWIGVGTFIIIVIFSIWYFRRK